MKKILPIIICLLFIADFVEAQKVEINAQLRPRFEINGKDFNSDTNPITFTTMRSRLGVKITKDENLMGFVQLQDTRVWGSEGGTLADNKNVDLHQAYFLIKNMWGKQIDLKMGRMEVAYGPQRLVGAVGWHNVGRSFDGAIVKIKSKKFDVDLFAFQEVEEGKHGDKTDKFFSGAYGKLKLAKTYKIEPFLFWERDVKTALSRFTLGGYIKGDLKGLFHEIEFAYQLGDIGPAGVSAFMGALNVGYKFKTSAKPVLSAGIDYLSGDDGTDSDYNVFSTLYATNHKYYGFMDYFLNIPAHTYGLGLMDLHVKGAINVSKKHKLAAAIHIFNSAEDYTLLNGSTATDFGTEIDLTFTSVYSKNVKFVEGISFFSPGDIFKETKGEDSSLWAYVMVIVNF